MAKAIKEPLDRLDVVDGALGQLEVAMDSKVTFNDLYN